MTRYWNELIPIDRYVVKVNGLLQEADRKIITMLYQPLIGFRGYSLFMTLWSELEQDRLWGEESTHHSIMTTMQCNLKDIHQERLKLEAIGLLKTYVKEEENVRTFIYELQPPLTPETFFSDPMLNIYLYNRLGKSKYVKVKNFFSDEIIPNTFQNITRSFHEVFASIQAESMMTQVTDEVLEDSKLDEDLEWITKKDGKEIEVKHEGFDFSLFYAGLSEVVIPRKSITPKVEEAISKLSFLYHIDPITMKDIVMNAIDDDDTVNIEELRKVARDWYQLENKDGLPTLVERTQPVHLRKMDDKKPKSKDEQLIQMLENVSPKQLLTDFSGGDPSISDLWIVEDVMFKQQLPAGVVNVLLYYVLLKTDMKLNRNYVEKIASHWARKRVTTVIEAMELAKAENRQYQNWAKTKQTKSNTTKQTKETPNRNRFISEKTKEEEEKETVSAQEENKRKLAERLEKLKLNKGK
ncbi:MULTISPECIES: replication initiation and membrane attachment family protein [Sutcliffiella]|uniref:replication initiation and membrane attachment family protein n=1 Tax=Sutcliffiella TaxID=2837511 RepID=UPI0022DD78B1|nr:MULTISPECIES: DnaD domain protein [Sutcliffiella]MED4016236.1 DnaD domain protein [Sutcliffiella cohnii]WBL14071.1 DnaD domain protein [Sutcliffiella sp. NC1]